MSLTLLKWDMGALQAQDFTMTFPESNHRYAACVFSRARSLCCSQEGFTIALEQRPGNADVEMRIYEDGVPHNGKREPRMGPPMGPNYQNTYRTFRTLASGAWLSVALTKTLDPAGAAAGPVIKVRFTEPPRGRVTRQIQQYDPSAAGLVPVQREARAAMLALPSPDQEDYVDFKRPKTRRKRDTSPERKDRFSQGFKLAGLIALSVVARRALF